MSDNKEITTEDVRKWIAKLDKAGIKRREGPILRMVFPNKEAADKWWKEVWIPLIRKAAEE